ncbi:MAG TPA: glycoside hydrolase family 43 protein [Polyangiaceae bacterium]|nr:glycoside hydrolase family 43 protein [Polyangiaceae bacterium]
MTVAWVLSYFGPEQDVAADSLHLAYSTDGLHWTRLGCGGPAYQLTGMGTNHIRDPFILRKQDGSFVYLATDWTLSNNDRDYWNRPSSKILIADSKDLITFTNPRLLRLTSRTGPGGKAMHAWAPEAYYAPDHEQYAIIWSGNDDTDRNRIYVSYTKDFESLLSPEPQVLFDPGYSVIDGTIVTWGGSSYLFFKDETDNDGGASTGSGKDIQLARAASELLTPGGFVRSDPSYIPRGTRQDIRQATEGPFVIRDPQRELWYLYADLFTQAGKFGCWSTTNLDAKPSEWRRVAQDGYSMPAGVRHANTVRVSQAELDALKAHYK